MDDPRRPLRHRALLAVALLVLPVAALAGCISQPSVELTVRPGDLVEAELFVGQGNEVLFPPGVDQAQARCIQEDPRGDPAGCPGAAGRFVAADQLPATLPTGWEDALPV
ncbi:MAG: hypothetical protein R3185_07855, partial [Candidatus Thermoplasmatota archaeon]|nr:hypothetical protein [Candidatus Thermoplasmatota archaeon]